MTMDELKIKNNIAKNIAYYRKRNNLTQLELAEKLSYSDKAISKWERGEGLPDFMVMLKLCELLGITLNDLISDKVKKHQNFLRNKIIITILSCLLVWVVTVLVYVILGLSIPNSQYTWLCFIYAFPITAIVLIVFTAIWGKRWMVAISVSVLIWTVCVGIYLPLHYFYENGNNALVFYLGIPIQILCIFWFLLKRKKKEL